MHRHFRMIAIAEELQMHCPGRRDHLRAPGIWAKLDRLYNLELLNDIVGITVLDHAAECPGRHDELGVQIRRKRCTRTLL